MVIAARTTFLPEVGVTRRCLQPCKRRLEPAWAGERCLPNGAPRPLCTNDGGLLAGVAAGDANRGGRVAFSWGHAHHTITQRSY